MIKNQYTEREFFKKLLKKNKTKQEVKEVLYLIENTIWSDFFIQIRDNNYFTNNFIDFLIKLEGDNNITNNRNKWYNTNIRDN